MKIQPNSEPLKLMRRMKDEFLRRPSYKECMGIAYGMVLLIVAIPIAFMGFSDASSKTDKGTHSMHANFGRAVSQAEKPNTSTNSNQETDRVPDFNKTLLMGRLTSDPELRRINSGTAVTELRMAVNKNWKGKDGEKREEVLYVDVTVWDRLAEICCQYLTKGSAVFVEGSLKMDTWDDKTTGEKRSKIKVNGETVQFLDSKPRDGGGGGQRQEPARGRSEAPEIHRGGGAAPPGRGGYQGQGRGAMTQREADDQDIPF